MAKTIAVKKTKSQNKAQAAPPPRRRRLLTAFEYRASFIVDSLASSNANEVSAASDPSTVIASDPPVGIVTPEPLFAIVAPNHSATVATQASAVATRSASPTPKLPSYKVVKKKAPKSKALKLRRSGPVRKEFGVDRTLTHEPELVIIRPGYPEETGRKACFENALVPGAAKNIELSIQEVDRLFLLRGESKEYIEDYHRRRWKQYGAYRQRGSDHCAEQVRKTIANNRALKKASAGES
ncbi:hypothetical protein EYC84_004949 [Monilinia fructicola]|uniref:Uncharacterized protein n=1 Tax=Monilinia fructicola TaxID=38448 RepID=A0A5M9K2U1_MONFR|nr:hypothetical protein EYC84_004949 [Monilinia fructicola]